MTISSLIALGLMMNPPEPGKPHYPDDVINPLETYMRAFAPNVSISLAETPLKPRGLRQR
ncbi:MAG: hypothetical protein AAB036_09480 [Elusimicrobiota bacterium]